MSGPLPPPTPSWIRDRKALYQSTMPTSDGRVCFSMLLASQVEVLLIQTHLIQFETFFFKTSVKRMSVFYLECYRIDLWHKTYGKNQ